MRAEAIRLRAESSPARFVDFAAGILHTESDPKVQDVLADALAFVSDPRAGDRARDSAIDPPVSEPGVTGER